MSPRTTLLLIAACAFVSGACGGPRDRARSCLRHGGGERLRHDAAMIYKDIFSGHGRAGFVEIPAKNWPNSFRELRPLHVGAYIDGIAIAMHATAHGETGLYVVPQSMEHTPKAMEGTRFEKIAEGIYWFSFGN